MSIWLNKIIKDFCQGKKDISQQVAQKLATYFKVNKDFWTNLQNRYNSVNYQEEKEVEIIEAKELEKNKSCQITLRIGDKELKEMFPSQWKEIKIKANLERKKLIL